MFCVDGLTGLKDVIQSIYPKTDVQRCIINQLRNSFKYVSYKHLKEFEKDFKEVYTTVNEQDALDKLNQVKEKWGSSQYLYAIKSWESNWDVLSPFYKFPEEIRKIIYTTNAIEGLHRQFRRVTKTKTTFPLDDLASLNVMKNRLSATETGARCRASS